MIIINKKIFFLITVLTLLFKVTNVKAVSFYEGEYIDNIYMNKYNRSNQTIYYQKARFFRRSDNNQFAYCIEPMTFFTNPNAYYEETLTPRNLTSEQINRIARIAYFGYNYGDHTDTKWYAITQLMIWQEADKNNDFYFTDGLNGPRINPFQNEIDSINTLIKDFEEMPKINNIYYLTKGNQTAIFPPNENSLKNLKTDNEEVKITDISIIFSPKEVGEYNYNFYKQLGQNQKPTIFYQSETSQNLMETGNIETNKLTVKVIVQNPTIKIYKEDEETNKIPQGQAKLDGTIVTLYDCNQKPIDTFEIKNNELTISNLYYGTYYIEETTPGEGYELNKERYKIELNRSNPEQTITIKNKVIKKEIKIVKKYGTENNLERESNIEFDVYDINNNLIETLITNEYGEASIILPYGEYKIIQKNTTEGYIKNDPFIVKVDSTEQEIIELKDLRIPVPDTNISILTIILRFLSKLIC